MSEVNIQIKLGYKAASWFTTNATLVLASGQVVYRSSDGKYKIGDGSTQLQNLTFYGGATSGTWGSITGTLSSQTDLQSALDAKEASITAGTTSQYWRGDKSWQALDTSAVAENGNLYFTNARADARVTAAIGSTVQAYNASTTTLGNTTTGSGNIVLSSAPTLVNPVVGTQAANDNSTKAASTAYVDAKKEYINQPIGWTSAFSPADSSTYYFSGWQLAPNTTNNTSRRKNALATGNVVGISLSMQNAAVSTNENSVLKIRNETTATEVTITSTWQITGAGQFNFDGFSLAITKGDQWVLIWETPAWVTNPVNTVTSGEILIEKTA
jgi:hypothetical protein